MIMYDFLYRAYDFYNKELFKNTLPLKVMITLERRANIKGFFSSSMFIDDKNTSVAQITLNPFYFEKGNEREVLSTFVHEMCHLKMDLQGEKPNGYHSKKWALMMNEIGLLPTDDGTKEGKQTGFRMTHLIIKGGLFDIKTNDFLVDSKNTFVVTEKNKGLENVSETNGEKKIKGRRIRYSCGCSLIWGKKGLYVRCEKCGNYFKEKNI